MTTQITSQSLLQQIAQIQHMERGKLCVLREGPDGPYYNHQTWEKGKNVARYVSQDQVQPLQQAIDGYNQFQMLMEQYVQMMIQKTRVELAAGFKKKSRRQTSSWPKTRKSSS